ncbi:MAG: hypothetical protein JST93_15720 [Acidobacteria bacterium]|nr:hypothetical protein [Acidobacteriota bacterium]
MAHYLHFFQLPEGVAPPPGTEATKIPKWIRANARPVGEMEFGAGRATFVLVALTEVCGVNLAPLQEGPWREWESANLDLPFGGLPRSEALAAIEGLRVVAASPAKQAQLAQAAVKWGLRDEKMLDRCAKLASLLETCVANGGEVVSMYR